MIDAADVGGVELPNRTVVPPMHRNSAAKGFSTDWHLMKTWQNGLNDTGKVL
jgi:2,4-dienoyl-CoA reductase-like NADH-dependent reductase (Old Yellow Enzyme family)